MQHSTVSNKLKLVWSESISRPLIDLYVLFWELIFQFLLKLTSCFAYVTTHNTMNSTPWLQILNSKHYHNWIIGPNRRYGTKTFRVKQVLGFFSKLQATKKKVKLSTSRLKAFILQSKEKDNVQCGRKILVYYIIDKELVRHIYIYIYMYNTYAYICHN